MLEAQEQLVRMKALDWPKMSRSARSKVHKDLFNQAFPKEKKQKKNIVTQADINRLLGVKDV